MPKKIKKKIEEATKSFEKLASSIPVKKEIDKSLLIPTGSVLLNLECSGYIEGGYKLGTIVNLIGDSSSGKSLCALTMLAECSIDPRFDEYRLIYDDVEAACEFDIEQLFGKQASERIETDIQSNLFEEFDDNFEQALDDDRPFIYVLDSFDALTTKQALEQAEKNKKAREKGTKESGSYGDGKAKLASGFFSRIVKRLADKKSFLLVISQTRDNLGFGAMFTPKVRSGGKALKFYSTHEIWLACQKKEKKGRRVVITEVQAKITKNKLTGNHGEAYFPIRVFYGIDNISSCIDFLMDEKFWTGTKKSIDTKGFVKDKISKANLIRYIEENDLEEELYALCQKAYEEIMVSLLPKRKPKFRR